MVDVDKAVIARLNSQGEQFELLVDCDAAIAVRDGKDVDLHDLLAAQKVFSDAHKGFEASETAVKQLFGTTDIKEVSRRIIQKGELQLTQEYREKLREQKYRRIVNLLHTNGVDPRTHNPHPVQRIENAIAETKVHIDEFRPAESQLQDILKKLRVILPIKFETKEVEVKISPTHAGRTYGAIKGFGTILKEEWQSNGYWRGVVEIPGGLEADFYSKLNDLTHGEAEINVLKTK